MTNNLTVIELAALDRMLADHPAFTADTSKAGWDGGEWDDSDYIFAFYEDEDARDLAREEAVAKIIAQRGDSRWDALDR